MTRYYTYLEDTTPEGFETISGVQQNGGEFGVGISNDINLTGNVSISGIATIGLGSTSSPQLNSSFSFELTDNQTLTIRVKGTDGVTRVGIVTLA